MQFDFVNSTQTGAYSCTQANSDGVMSAEIPGYATRKVYMEAVCDNSFMMLGLTDNPSHNWNGQGGGAMYQGNGGLYGSLTGAAPSGIASSGTIGMAVDYAARRVWWRDSTGWKNGDPVAGTDGAVIPDGLIRVYLGNGGAAVALTANVGDSAFAYAIPNGYVALNLPLSTLSGNAKLDDGVTPADTILIRDWATHAHVAAATPGADGAWSADVPAGQYDVTALKSGCAPYCHGPYTVT